jgi:hypothetical protein
MRVAMREIREFSPAKRENDYGLENALAKYVRNRWPDKPIAYVAHEWDLSDAEASKVVYANASKNTLNKLLRHKRGGFKLFIELLCDATNTKLEHYITNQAEEAANEARKWAAEERRLAILQARVSGPRGVDGPAVEQVGTDGPENEGLGARPNGFDARPVDAREIIHLRRRP